MPRLPLQSGFSLQTFGASVLASPSDTTAVGRAMRKENPDCSGSLGMAISEAIEVAGLPLGAFAEATYEERTVTLDPGDVLVFHTDGLSEALGSGGEYGIERLREKALPDDHRARIGRARDRAQQRQAGRQQRRKNADPHRPSLPADPSDRGDV